jgi:hypothetical protein
MRIFNSVIPASKIQSSRPLSRDLPNSLAPLKWPFKEIPAQEHAGMTEGLACADDGVVACVYAYMRIFNSVIPANKI